METIFAKIIRRELPADIVYEDDQFLAFKDINPQAPTHILVIPKNHIESIKHMEEEHVDVIGSLLYTAKKVAQQVGLDSYRIVFNSGPEAGQTVFHLHLHLLGGAPSKEGGLYPH